MSTKLHPWRVRELARDLLAGKIVAYPTEAVWGLGCDYRNQAAVERLLALKSRPVDKGLILATGQIEQVEPLLALLPEEQAAKARSVWPGPYTCVIPDPEQQIPEWIRGEHDSVAIRVSRHPLIGQLSQALGMPLVSTSCNPAGRPPARTAWQVARYFGQEVDVISGGDTGGARAPSTIIDVRSGKQLR